MKNFIILVISILSFNSIYSQQYKLDTESSKIKWIGRAAVGSYSPEGSLKPLMGLLVIDQDSIKRLEVKINMKSLNSEYPKLTKHLKSKDFFEVKKFDKSRFLMIIPAKIINNKANIEGQFEIKGKIRKEKIEINLNRQNNRIIITDGLSLDRTAYGIIYNSESFFDDLKDQAIADLFEVELNLEFIID